ncbi:hypothetical protein VPNG_08402 [Cytospora leucostoma]|uniref:G-patch domain-containing protein n=1 Tax=Cytospora leucostoma TaxID=1230097 RepID=A0A423W646_9PEZI|nr:hypothetical protein VPNG_08402 [Cytospora leucostoma]
MAAPPPPPKGGGMSLYANLLNPKADASATVSGAPVVYDNGEKEDASVKKDAIPALRFQPIRRPQINQKKPAIKPSFPKSIPTAANNTNNNNAATASTAASRDVSGTSSPAAAGDAPAPAPAPAPPQRSTLADWAATEEDEYMYGAAAAAEKRQRGGRRAKKKNNKSRQSDGQRGTDWDEIYDPSRPTNVDEYLRSDERVREVQEWKSVLYAHRRKLRKGSYDSEEDDSEGDARPAMGNQFAPPGDYSFAPPPMSPQARTQATHPPPPQLHPPPPPPPDDATGDDAFARRLAMSQGIAPPPPISTTDTPTPPPPPPPPEEPSGATIARAPVRYEAPPQPPPTTEQQDDHDEDMDIDDAAPLGLGASNRNDNDTAMPDADDNNNNTPRTNRPGQKGFAQRLMSKYGWTAGSGLGAEQTGIVNPLQVKVEKRRKRPDAEGGGFAEPGGRARIIGGKVSAAAAAAATAADRDRGKFGAMSEVVVLRGMLEGMENLQGEVEGGLGQEIGEECGDKYGRVERLYIDVGGRQVFIKFTDQVSALRAVNALEGRVFNGNTIAARFWDAEDFEKGVYS